MIIYGYHACCAALNNPDRVVKKIMCLDQKTVQSLPIPEFRSKKIPTQILDKRGFSQLIKGDSVHQGVALEVDPLRTHGFDILDNDNPNQIVVVLDQITDPQNIGAIMRSAATFGAAALVFLDRSTPKETPSLVKTASGAFEIVPRIMTNNLVSAMKTLQKMGFWTVGFSEEARKNLHQIDLKGKIALIMGSEGDGIRRLTEKNCDFHVKLPTSDQFSTLNVSSATAVALYEVFRSQNT